MSDGLPQPAPENPHSHPEAHHLVARAAVRGVTWLAGERWINQFVAAGVFVVLGRLVAPQSFGLIAAANVIILFFRVLVDGGFSRALIQMQNLDELDIDTAFWTSMGIGVLLTAVTIAASPLFALLFDQSRLRIVVIALSPVFVLAALDSTQSALVDRAMKFRVQAIRRTIAIVVSSAAAVVVAVAGGGVWALVAQTLTYELLVVILLWSLSSWRPRRRWSRDRARTLMTFGAGITGIKLTSYLSGNADNFLIGIVLGPVTLGLYVVAYRVVVVLHEVTGLTLSRVSVPVFARYQRDPERLQRAFLDSCELGLLVALPLFTGLAILGDRAVPMLFGPRWVAAGSIAQVLALAGVAQMPAGQLQNIVVAANRIGNEFRWTCVSAAALVISFAVTVHFGAVWVALSIGVTITALVPVRIWWIAHHGLLPRDTVGKFYAAVGAPAVPAAVMAVAMLLTRLGTDSMPDYAVVLVGSAVGVVAYVLALRLLAAGTWRLAIQTARRFGNGEPGVSDPRAA